MSEPPQPTTSQNAGASSSGEAHALEELDALPVLGSRAHLVPAHAGRGRFSVERSTASTVLPAVQAAAVAAGGFVAGAAVVGLVHRRHRRSAALSRGRRGGGDRSRRGGRGVGAGDLLQIVGSRSLLLDVHLLGGSGDR